MYTIETAVITDRVNYFIAHVNYNYTSTETFTNITH